MAFAIPGVGQALSPSLEADGDIFIGEDFVNDTWMIGGIANINGDLTIRAGGTVIVTDGTLNFRSWEGHINQLVIEDGGQLILSNSAVTAEDILYNVTYSLGVLVRNNGALYAENSLLGFEGKILVDNAIFVATGTTISGPLFTAMSSQVEMYDSQMIGFPGIPADEDPIYPYSFATSYTHSLIVDYLFERNPDTVSTGQDVSDLQMNDASNVTLAEDETVTVTGFDIGGLIFDEGEAESVILKAEYKTADDFESGTPDVFQYAEYLAGFVDAVDMEVIETYEAYAPAETNQEKVLSQDLSVLDLSSIDLSVLSVTLTNTKAQNVYIDRIWVEVELGIPAYHNITFAGTSEFTAVNSYLGVNYWNYSVPAYRKLVVMDAAQANLYGVEVQGEFYDEGVGPFVTIEEDISFKPLSKGVDDTTGEATILDLLYDNAVYYVVPGGAVLHASSFITGGLVGDVSSAAVVVEYTGNVGYTSSQYMQWNLTGSPLKNTNILIDSLILVVESSDLPYGEITNIDQLSMVNIEFANPDDDSVSFDRIWITVELNPTINVYRWVDVSVLDKNNLPVTGAYVNATEPLNGPARYYYQDAVSEIPPEWVLDYLGRDVTNYKITDDSGLVTLPLLTDIVNSMWAPNSYAIENYRIEVDYMNVSSVHFIPSSEYPGFDSYPDLEVQSLEMQFILEDLELELPDVVLTNLSNDPSTVYQGDTVTLTFTVANNGVTTARAFNISVMDSIGNQTNSLGNITVTNLLPMESRVLTVIWGSNFTTPGTHSIILTGDSLNQVIEGDENNVLTAQIVVLAFLPDLSVTPASIAFSQNPGFAKQAMYINVTVSNVLGRLVAMDAEVSFYIGNPLTGGEYLGTNMIEVAPGGTSTTSFMWTPIQIGVYPIYVTVNEDRSINEYRYDNNMASSALVVILVAEESDWLVNTTWPNIYAANIEVPGNLIVEADGYLSFTGTQLFMRQYSDNLPTQIVVRDSGTLVLDQSTVSSNMLLRVYLFNNARLFLNSSTLNANVILIMDDSSSVYMEESNVMGDLQAPASSSGDLVAYNTTFGRVWSYFGGSSVAELTGASINGAPAISPRDDAIVTLYSWVVASVYDGTGEHKIPGAHVEARAFFTQTLYTTGETDDLGVWQFRALSDVITSSGRGINIGYYQLNATHWYDDVRYDSDVDMPANVLYSPDTPLVRSDAMVRLDISTALPDIDPPFTVSNDEPLRSSEVSLSTTINNIGVVTAYNILVRFEDNSSAGKVLIEDYIIDELAPLSNVTVTVIWIATYPLGTHNLSVMVDPLNQIPELNETNNLNYTTVNVLGVPDLLITAADITIDPNFPIRDKAASITVSVRNIGDNATSAFNVSFYDELTLIGTREISNIPSGGIGVASISWTPTTPGLRNVTVMVDEENVIIESNENNNMAKVIVFVRDYPDLLASSVSFSIGGSAVSKAFVNQEVTITATIYNIGESAADEFDVVFWLNGIDVIQIVRVANIPAGEVYIASATWVAEIIPGMDLYQNNTIIAEVNPASNTTIIHIPEMDDPVNENNVASQVLLVIDNRPDLAISDGRVQSGGLNVTSATIGENIHILFDLKNVGIIDASNVNVTVSLVNATIDMPLFSQVRNVAASGTIPYDVSWIVNVTSGDYSIVVTIDAGAEADTNNNIMDIDFTISTPSILISIDLGGKTDYAPGASIYVPGTIKQNGTNAPLANQLVKVRIVDNDGFPLTSEYTDVTDADGNFYTWVPVPTGKEGEQILEVTVETIEGEFTHEVSINIVAPITPETIPSWVYLLIVAIVIAVIVIFSLYLYRVGLGRMVECGNCGALIPEVSKHCPKCGVEFESDTAKCSECGAWIPSKAESCPDCGAKFLTEPIEQGQAPGYIEAMRNQYEEYIDGFREQAKAALGNKYSEEKFMEWLQTEPNYLPFEEWLRKEEMSRRSGVFPCPACGTLNPRDSKICNRCGTVFDEQSKAEVATKVEEKKSPFRRIVRRSSEAKEEPKEKPPAEEKSKEDENKAK